MTGYLTRLLARAAPPAESAQPLVRPAAGPAVPVLEDPFENVAPASPSDRHSAQTVEPEPPARTGSEPASPAAIIEPAPAPERIVERTEILERRTIDLQAVQMPPGPAVSEPHLPKQPPADLPPLPRSDMQLPEPPPPRAIAPLLREPSRTAEQEALRKADTFFEAIVPRTLQPVTPVAPTSPQPPEPMQTPPTAAAPRTLEPRLREPQPPPPEPPGSSITIGSLRIEVVPPVEPVRPAPALTAAAVEQRTVVVRQPAAPATSVPSISRFGWGQV